MKIDRAFWYFLSHRLGWLGLAAGCLLSACSNQPNHSTPAPAPHADAALAAAPVPEVKAGEPIFLTHSPQLFLDDALVARQENLKRIVQTPQKHPANPMLVQEYPWEKRYIQIYGTVLYEPELKQFRMWYMASERQAARPESYIAYAVSEDGIHWRKPMVGTANLPDATKHNVVLMGGHGMCIIKDMDDPDPHRRYKGLGGETLAFSADGIHWSTEAFSAAEKNDTSSCVVKWRGEYLAYVRNQAYFGDPVRIFMRKEWFWTSAVREVALTRSTDFHDWSTKETVLSTFNDSEQYPFLQPYGMAVTPYGDMLLGLVWMIDLDPVGGNYKHGDQFIQLARSRDGVHWNWVENETPFLDVTPDTWDEGRVIPGTTLIQNDDQIYLYYTGSTARHGEGFGKMGIGLATLPADRFVALEQLEPGREGTLETVPLQWQGKDLLVNAEIQENDLQVELVQEDGRVVEGFDRRRSHLARRDSLRWQVEWWDNGRRLSLADAPKEPSLRIRFVLKQGKLFAFQVGNQYDEINVTNVQSFSKKISATTDEDKDDVDFYLQRGELRLRKGQLQSALADFNKIIELQPNHGRAHAYAAMIEAMQNQLENAEIHVTKALVLDASDALSHYARGVVFYAQNRFYGAIFALDNALHLEPNRADLFADRGYLHTLTQDYELAVADLTRALELDPQESFARLDRSQAYLWLGKSNEAKSDCDQVLVQHPKNVMALRNRGLSELLLNQYDAAIVDLEKAIDYETPMVLYSLACAYALKAKNTVDTNQRMKSINFSYDYLEKSIEVEPGFKEYINQDPKLEIRRNDSRFDQWIKELQ